MRIQQAIICAVPVLFLACQTVPEGFTAEAWERYQRENPNGAQVVRWIHESSERRELKRKCMEASQKAVGDQEFAGIWFTDQAQFAMLQGQDLKKFLIDRLQSGVASSQSHLDSNRRMSAQNGWLDRPNEMLERSLRRDRAMLEALTH